MKKTFIILLLGIVAGMATCKLLQKPKQAISSSSVDYIPAVTIKKELQKEESRYQQEKQQLHQQITLLQDAHQILSQKIAIVKTENKQLRQQVGKQLLYFNTKQIPFLICRIVIH